MSVGRQVCKHLIDTAEDMRQYAGLISEFDNGDNAILYLDLLRRAEGLEALVTQILTFEGEMPKLLTAGTIA